MDTVVILTGLVIILVLAVLIFAAYIHNIKKSLKNMIVVLNDIENGNANRKALVRDGDIVADICYKLNEIVSSYNTRIVVLQKSEKAYKQLLTSLSHDVRTPLTSLIGYLDAINDEIVGGAEKDGYLEIAINKAYNLKDFIDRLFEWFKLDSKERSFYFENIDINELTRSIIADWISIFEKNSVTFHVDIPEKEYNILLDINAYTRMLNNIIQNSLKHSGGTRIDISVMQNRDIATINISDNGKGISEKDINLIFDRLYKCDESRSRKGNGLGLSIVKELAVVHGGTVSAASIPKEKTTFTITLPTIKVL